jgi:hypothetical protein
MTMKTKFPIGPDYAAFVTDLKARIRSARLSAARAVNRELILIYWDIGRGIVGKQLYAAYAKPSIWLQPVANLDDKGQKFRGDNT